MIRTWPYLISHDHCMTVPSHMMNVGPHLSTHVKRMTIYIVVGQVQNHTCRHMSSAWPYLSSHEQCMTVPAITWATVLVFTWLVHDCTWQHMSSAWSYLSSHSRVGLYLPQHQLFWIVPVFTWSVHDRTYHHMRSAWPYLSSHEQCMTVWKRALVSPYSVCAGWMLSGQARSCWRQHLHSRLVMDDIVSGSTCTVG
jgi:hypothetical protein